MNTYSPILECPLCRWLPLYKYLYKDSHLQKGVLPYFIKNFVGLCKNYIIKVRMIFLPLYHRCKTYRFRLKKCKIGVFKHTTPCCDFIRFEARSQYYEINNRGKNMSRFRDLNSGLTLYFFWWAIGGTWTHGLLFTKELLYHWVTMAYAKKESLQRVTPCLYTGTYNWDTLA